ncbi:hypothetical protein CEXT_417351 [Caerostris extrusa]|uniref:Uncharacterized protein n=1 Tax=Caerostris extrusa TaxID=172846 RepID=A0AAV4SCC6_CAEEX|nr:hypothetical protein CEXT_417351 [Caerostris extrusa]
MSTSSALTVAERSVSHCKATVPRLVIKLSPETLQDWSYFGRCVIHFDREVSNRLSHFGIGRDHFGLLVTYNFRIMCRRTVPLCTVNLVEERAYNDVQPIDSF